MHLGNRMLNRSISILVATALLACPLICGAGSLVVADAEMQPARCSCCHQSEVPTKSQQQNERPNDSEGCCQCVCGGAVFEHVPQQHVELDFGVWTTPATAKLPLTLTLAHQNDAARALLKPDDGMNPGRRRCCLFMTFLC